MTQAQDLRPHAVVTLTLLFGMNLLDYIDRNILAAVLPHIQEEMRLSSTQAGALSPAFLIAYTVFAPLMGWAGDRYNRTRRHSSLGMLSPYSAATVSHDPEPPVP